MDANQADRSKRTTRPFLRPAPLPGSPTGTVPDMVATPAGAGRMPMSHGQAGQGQASARSLTKALRPKAAPLPAQSAAEGVLPVAAAAPCAREAVPGEGERGSPGLQGQRAEDGGHAKQGFGALCEKAGAGSAGSGEIEPQEVRGAPCAARRQQLEKSRGLGDCADFDDVPVLTDVVSLPAAATEPAKRGAPLAGAVGQTVQVANLKGYLCAASAAALCGVCAAARFAPVKLDLSQVTGADAAGASLLLGALLDMSARGSRFEVCGHETLVQKLGLPANFPF